MGQLDRRGALEVAPVVPQDNSKAPEPHHDYNTPADEESGPSSQTSSANSYKEDFEKYNNRPEEERTAKTQRPDSISSQATITLLDKSTPFFHFDLADALNTLGLNGHAML